MGRDITSFEALAKTIVADVNIASRNMQHTMHGAGEIVKQAAQKKLGRYQPGWDSLKPATISRKRRGDTPLYETGLMHDSLDVTAHPRAAFIGVKSAMTADGKSDVADIAVYQEFGTPEIPARPFLGPALAEKQHQVVTHIVNGFHKNMQRR